MSILEMIERDAAAIMQQSTRRTHTIERRAMDTDARSVDLAIASGRGVMTLWGTEYLAMSAEAINLERAADGGLPLLYNHSDDQIIGRVENVRLDGDGVLRGTARFAKGHTLADQVWSLVEAGILRDVSVRATRDDVEPLPDGEGFTVTAWTPLEASIVTVPADHTVGINRSNKATSTEGTTMPDHDGAAGANNTGGAAGTSQGVGASITDLASVRQQARSEGVQEGRRQELARIAEINDLFVTERMRTAAMLALRDDCINSGTSVADTQRAIIDAFASGTTPIQSAGDGDHGIQRQHAGGHARTADMVRVQAGGDWSERFAEGVSEALLLRAQFLAGEAAIKARGNEFNGWSLVELARGYLQRAGVECAGLSRAAMIGKALTVRSIIGHSASDFPAILENIANKMVMISYEQSEETWAGWCRIGNLSDFKAASRPVLGTFPALTVVPENGEFKYKTVSDKKEPIQLATYGGLFSISRQALINDDLNEIAMMSRKMGQAAARVPGDLAYGILTSNPTMNEDSTALFHSTHGNDVAGGSGAPPSVSTVEAARTAMATQALVGEASAQGSGTTLRLGHLMVPVALEGTARVLAAAEFDPSTSNDTRTPNSVRGTFAVHSDARLDRSDPLEWFASATERQVEVAFLDGDQTPRVEIQNGWTVDGAEFKVAADVAAAALDWRGLYRNDGN